MKYSELERLLKKKTNCVLLRNGKNHPIWINRDTGKTFPTGYHKNQEVAKGTLNSILREAGLK